MMNKWCVNVCVCVFKLFHVTLLLSLWLYMFELLLCTYMHLVLGQLSSFFLMHERLSSRHVGKCMFTFRNFHIYIYIFD